MTDAALLQRRTGAAGKPFENRRVGNAVTPVPARHPAAAGETVARESQALDAERRGVFHQNLKNRGMQMQVQMAVDMVKRQAGGAEFCKLRVNFRAQLFAQAALKKITKTGGDGIVAEPAARIGQTGDFSRRQGGFTAKQRQVQANAQPWVLPRRATASSQAGSFTIKLAVVRMPSRCARTTAALMECERPKSSALTMRRHPDCGLQVSDFGFEEANDMA